MWDIIIGAIVIAVIALALFTVLRDKKAGKNSCGYCTGCSGCKKGCGGGSCGMADNLDSAFPEEKK